MSTCPSCKKWVRVLHDWCANQCCYTKSICPECRYTVSWRKWDG